jgi:cytochrome b561
MAKARAIRTKVSGFASAAGEGNLPEVYNGAMQVFHWTVGGSIVACIGLVQVAQYYKGKTKMQMMYYHKSFGLLAGMLVVPRLAVRATSMVPVHPPGPKWEILAGTISHYALYGFMVWMPFTGILMGYYSGKGLPFFWTSFSGGKDGKLAGQFFKLHKQVGTYGQYLVPVHVGAVGYHYAIHGRNLFTRILGSAPKA